MSSGPTQVDSITVVGGGDAGLLTALALDKGVDVSELVVVDDFGESVPEVGKSTLSYVADFLFYSLEIDPARLLKDVELAWKTTVYFKDWCGVERFHSPLGLPLPIVNSWESRYRASDGDEEEEFITNNFSLTPDQQAEFHEFYYRYQQRNFTTLYGEVAEEPGTAPIGFADNVRNVSRALPDLSYHFHSTSFNEFLRTLCRERGVELIDDRITEVKTSDNQIESIESDTAEYRSDLYVDASGFKRLLMGELDNPLVEFDLPVDSAIATTMDIPLSDITSATVVTSGDSGWFWQIDTGSEDGGTRDIGYVYSSDHISDEAAKREFIETRDEEIDPDNTRRYQFDSGVLERPWLNNCVAIGNALGFVEPLQSTALTTTCFLANQITRTLAKHGCINHTGLREVFSDSAWATWEEVYDFISIYYKYNSGSTQFWEDARSINPGKLQQYEYYQDVGFSGWRDLYRLTRTDTDLNDYYLYYLVYSNLGVESDFYESLDVDVDPDVASHVEEYTDEVSDRLDELLTYEEFFTVFHPQFQ